ncbi:SERTA domain-containing protein 3 [Stygiomarasmius scandens]|uniref:SERTA domain-containing protein 3 n=1 Tax=Marasmiellus scandens TaxID=2682957 RepID=A0ABR1JIG8_9AGAR
MPQANSKRNKPELEAEDILPKVRLISQPEFGHELRQAQQTNAELRGQVAHLEWTGRMAKNRVTKLENELAKLKNERDELAEDVKQLQGSESDEVQRLGTENVALSRRVSHNDIELQTLRNLVQALGISSEVANGVPLIPGHSAVKNTEQDEVSVPLQNQNDDGTQDDEDPCERESSVLRNVEAEPAIVHRILYPLDALSSTKAQKWFPQAFAYVDVDLGPEYRDFVAKWVDFERFHQWERNGGRLDKTDRPKEITVWITEGRYLPRCKGPKVDADFVKTFPDDMRKWLDFLQGSTPLHREVDRNNDWASLDKHGINGWFSVVAGMKWWGEGLKSLTGDSLRKGTEEWLTMTTELSETLNTLKCGSTKVANS